MEHIALYRQFRPQTFDDIVEQENAVTTLRQTVISGKIGHAYLFCGTRGTGKTTIAKVFSRAINCEHPINGNPCNECPTCKGISDSTLMDVIEIDAASNNSVDNVRKICEEVVYAPSRAPYKVYIIDEVHMLSTGAFNALLKTLEEPPKHAVFLLATTEPHKIPATILSRCQRFDFKRITLDAIVKRLQYICSKESIPADDEALRLIASLADGALRDSISLLDQAQSAAQTTANGNKRLITAQSIEEITGTVDRKFMYNMADVLIKGSYDKLLPLCDELFKSGRDLTRFAIDLGGYFRDLLVVRMMPDPTSLVTASATTLKAMYSLASTVSAETLVAFISYLSNLVSELKWSPSTRTTFEISLLRLCGRKVKTDIPPLVIPDFVKKQAKAAEEISARYNESNADNAVKDNTPSKEASSELNKSEETAKTVENDSASNKKDDSVKSSADNNSDNKNADIKSSETEKDIEVKEVKTEESSKTSDSAKADKVTENTDLPKPAVSLEANKPAEADKPVESTKSAESAKSETTEKSENKEEKKSVSDLFSSISSLSKSSSLLDRLNSDVPKTPGIKPDDDIKKSFVEQVASNPDIPEEDKPLENQMDLFSMGGVTEKKPSNSSRKSKLSQFSSNSGLFSTPSSLFTVSDTSAEDSKPKIEPEKNKEETKIDESENKKSTHRSMIAEVYDSSKDLPELKIQEPKKTSEIPSDAPVDINALWSGIVNSFADEDYEFYLKISGASIKSSENHLYIIFAHLDENSVKELISSDSCKILRNKLKAVFPEYSFFMCSENQYNTYVGKNGGNQAEIKKNFAEYVNNRNETSGMQGQIDFSENW